MLLYEVWHCIGLTLCSDFEVASAIMHEFANPFNCSPFVYCILYVKFLLIKIVFSTVLIVRRKTDWKVKHATRTCIEIASCGTHVTCELPVTDRTVKTTFLKSLKCTWRSCWITTNCCWGTLLKTSKVLYGTSWPFASVKHLPLPPQVIKVPVVGILRRCNNVCALETWWLEVFVVY